MGRCRSDCRAVADPGHVIRRVRLEADLGRRVRIYCVRECARALGRTNTGRKSGKHRYQGCGIHTTDCSPIEWIVGFWPRRAAVK